MNPKATVADPLYAAIIGSGFAGICMGVGLSERQEDNFLIFETADDLGGTWRENTYPGCGCDVRSHLYSFSFFPKSDWTRSFSKQDEIWQYMKDCAKHFGLYPHFRFKEGIMEARWLPELSLWHLESTQGQSYYARFLVTGTGGLSIPNHPSIKGKENFTGKSFHSASWDHDFDLKGKKVCVIGTGASAVQFVPEIAPEAGNVTLFQRTPPWIMPKPDRDYGSFRKGLYKKLPFFRKLNRISIFLAMEASTPLFVRYPRLHRFTKRIALRHMRRQVKNPELRALITPDYIPGCKRLLPSNNYYPALCRDNVQVETSGIQEIQAEGILDQKGDFHPADLIIYATGFKATEYLSQVKICNAKGESIRGLWDVNGGEAFKGTMVADFPNLFIFTGPNTGLGNNSMIHIIESQSAYIHACLDYLREKDKKGLSPKQEVQDAYNADLQKRLARSVWNTGGCNSWYLQENGKNTTLWPGSTTAFRRQTKRLSPENFEFF